MSMFTAEQVAAMLATRGETFNADLGAIVAAKAEGNVVSVSLRPSRGRDTWWRDFHAVVTPGKTGVLSEVVAERARRDELQGQDWPDLNSAEDAVDRGLAAQMADMERIGAADPLCRSWSSLLMVEVWEAHSQKDPAALRAELVQAGAVITAWVEAIDRRTAGAASPQPAAVPPEPMRECCREARGSHYHCGNCGSDDVTGMYGHLSGGRFRCDPDERSAYLRGKTTESERPSWDDGTCGDCASGKCHGTEPDECGCARHDASVAATPGGEG